MPGFFHARDPAGPLFLAISSFHVFSGERKQGQTTGILHPIDRADRPFHQCPRACSVTSVEISTRAWPRVITWENACTIQDLTLASRANAVALVCG